MKFNKAFFSGGIAVAVAILCAVVLTITTLSTRPVIAKDKPGTGSLITSADLDHADVQGATVKYQLTDEEMQGAPLFYSNGSVVRRMNATIIVDYTAIDRRRDEQGRRVARVRVDRPDYLGGAFEKDAPFDSGRSAGTIDTLQPGDLVH
jgi:hypothetical protein